MIMDSMELLYEEAVIDVVSYMLTYRQKVSCYSTEIIMEKQSKDGGLKPIIHTVSIVKGHYCW